MTRAQSDRRDERGQVLVIVAGALVALIAMVGLVIDGGYAWGQQRDTQNGADAAAKAETALKTGQGIEAVLTALTASLASTVAAIRAALPHDLPGNGGGAQADPKTVVEPLARLKQLLESDDGEAADFVVEARPALSGGRASRGATLALS